jgi:hypothetical protein
MSITYDENTKARAVRLVRDQRDDYDSEWAPVPPHLGRIQPLTSMRRQSIWSRRPRAAAHQNEKRYSLQITTTSARIPRPAIKPAMIADIEYGMGPTSAASVFISWRC